MPFVLAMLGDNPMQSEFACHIGLHGKLFCRACWVRGKDSTGDEGQAGDTGLDNQDIHGRAGMGVSDDGESDAGSSQGSQSDFTSDDDDQSDEGSVNSTSSAKKPKRRRKQVLDTMANMVKHVKAFIKVRLIRFPLLPCCL